MTTMPAKHVATSDGRDQKKGQYCIMHESRKHCQCSAKDEIATRTLAA